MEYQISPSAWNGVFALPCAVVDKHIKLAGSAQLKVLLWIFRHNGEPLETQKIAQALGMAEADVKDAMQYWIEAGLLYKSGGPQPSCHTTSTQAQPPSAPISLTEKKAADKPAILPPPIEKPTFQDVVRRANESDELKYLFQQAQIRLGKTISPADQSTLLWMHDWLGLPVEVILMIMEYAVMEGKTGMAYIEKVGIDWASNEIDTMEKAEERINEILKSKKAWNQICSTLDIPKRKPSKRELSYAKTWLELWHMELKAIALAYDECVNHTGKLSFSYMNKILERWHANGITTAKEAEAFDVRPAAAKGKKTPASTGASYDIDEFERMSIQSPIVYKKEG